jgi:hypothetical protein
MKCPKCGSENVSVKTYTTHHLSFCIDCSTPWYPWQQERIAALEKQIVKAEKLLKETWRYVDYTTPRRVAGVLLLDDIDAYFAERKEEEIDKANK